MNFSFDIKFDVWVFNFVFEVDVEIFDDVYKMLGDVVWMYNFLEIVFMNVVEGFFKIDEV